MAKFRIPLSVNSSVVKDALLELEWPVTEAEWEQLHAVLAAMKPALVREGELDGRCFPRICPAAGGAGGR